MKKSNILLLVGFLTIVVLISAIHITLYAKYKAGNYTIYNAEEDLTLGSMQTFPNIAFVSVRNVPSASVKYTDVAQVEKGAEEAIQYVRRGDTLVISSRDSANREHIGHQVLYLPSTATLSIFNSSLFFAPGKKNAEINQVIHLKKSNVHFSGTENLFQLGHLKIVATDSSAASFQGNTQINQLEVQLSNSSIEYGNGDFDQLSIVTDSLSRISLQSKHLLKANIKTIAPQ
jgi:hypothetical protein